MSNSKPQKRSVNGILLLNKPIGISSNKALQIVKHLYNAKKAGHTGSLDPLASGMLPICFGMATKYSQYLLTSHKQYVVTAKLGIKTTTGDAEGEVLAEKPVPALTLAAIDTACEAFRGDIMQIPPMYSALKHKGKPLYEYARQGITIEREARPLTVFSLEVLDVNQDLVSFRVHCSKGTYVRTLIEDIGEALGCGAHVATLHRPSVGAYREEDMITLDDLRDVTDLTELDTLLLPIETAVSHYPAITVSVTHLDLLRQGQAVNAPVSIDNGIVRVVDDRRFRGIAEINDGRLVKRHFV